LAYTFSQALYNSIHAIIVIISPITCIPSKNPTSNNIAEILKLSSPVIFTINTIKAKNRVIPANANTLGL